MALARTAGGGTTRKARPPARRPRKPDPAVFGPLAPATAGLEQAQRTAARKTQRARKRAEANIVVPAVPKVTGASPAARGDAQRRVARALKAQGVTTPQEVAALPKAQRQRVNRTVGYQRTQQRNLDATVVPDQSGTVTRRAAVGRALLAAERAVAKPGQPHTTVGLPGATIDLTSLEHKAGDALAGNPLSGFLKGGASLLAAGDLVDKLGAPKAVRTGLKLLANVPRDALTIAAEAVPSVYHLGSEVATGHIGQAFHQILQPYKNLYHDPGHAIVNDPVGSLLLASGVEGAVGRVAGAGARTAGRLGATGLGRAAGTRRSPLTLPGTAVEVRRDYSPDVIRKGVQVAGERRAAGKVARLQRRAATVEAVNPERAIRLRERAAVKTQRVTDREVRRRLDERWDAAHIMQRAVRDQAVVHVDRLLKGKGRAHTTLVSLVAQGIVKPTRADVRAYVDELRAQRPGLDRVGKRANQELVAAIEKSLGNKHLDLHRVAGQAAAFTSHVAPLERQLVDSGLITAEAAQRARLVPFAARRLGARVNRDGELVAPDGRVLSIAEVRQALRDHGVAEPAFVPQRIGWAGARNYYASMGKPASIDRRVRTGAATVQGTFQAHPEALRDQAARLAVLVEQQRGFNGVLHEFGFKPRGRQLHVFRSHQAAKEAAGHLVLDGDGHPIPGATDWVPVQAAPFRARQAQVSETLRAAAAGHSPVHAEVQRALAEALQDRHPAGPAPYVLMPRAVVEQMYAHTSKLNPGNGARALQAYSQLFRQSVLATSPKWLAGNLVEGALRSAVAGVVPVVDHAIYKRSLALLEKSDPRAAAELRARVTQGGQYALATRAPRRSADQFTDGPLKHIAGALGAIGRAPVGRQIVGSWRLYTKLVFHDVNARAERALQSGMAGRQIRRQLMDDRLNKLSAAAIGQAARGLRDTNEQVALGRAVDRMYGRYSKFSPGARQAIVLYTPFAAWALAATRFLGDVLPRDHPVLTSLLASASQATADWRRKNGQDLFAGRPVPSFLQGGIPEGGGSVLRLSRYTPFSIASDPLGTFAQEVLPQARDVLAAAQGKDWRGRPLHPNGTNPVQGAGDVAASLAGLLPFVGPGERVAGAKGSLTDRLRTVFDPFKASTPPSASAGGSGSVDWSRARIAGGAATVDWSRARIVP